MVRARLESLRLQNASRRDSVSRRIRSLDREARRARETRADVEELRSAVQEGISELASHLGEESRRAALPEAGIRKAATRSLERLTALDLAEEPTSTAIRLSVHEQFLQSVIREIRRSSRDGLRRNLLHLGEGLEALRERVESRLGDLSGVDVPLDVSTPDEATVWRSVEDFVRLELRYRGELPKRSFMQRLGEGRRVAFMVLIMFSLFGGAFSMRQSALFPIAMLSLFVGGFAYTFVSWKRQDQDRIAKELTRVKDSLSTELKRLITEIEREKAARLQTYLSEVQKSLFRQIDAVVKERGTKRGDRIEQEQSALRERAQLLEARAREMTAWEASLEKLSQSVAELDAESRRQLRGALRAAAPGRARGRAPRARDRWPARPEDPGARAPDRGPWSGR